MLKLIVFISVLVLVCGDNEYYCNMSMPETIIGVSEGMIITRKPGEQHYSNDLECVWKIDAGDDNKWIQLTVETLDLQWSPQYGLCVNYDYMDILDGFNEESPTLTSLCHSNNAYSLISKGRYLYLVFRTTNQNFYNNKGIEIRFKIFGKDVCPPGWFQVDSTSTECLMVGRPGKADFFEAQSICHLNKGNLASINSEQEHSAILDYGRNISDISNTAWIGLSDLAKDGTFAWIDKSNSYSRKVEGKIFNTHCVSMDFDTDKWIAKECNVELNYICKALKDGTSILYPAKPTTKPPEEESGGTNLFHIVIIAVIIVILIVGGIALYFYCRKTGKCSKQNSQTGKTPETPAGGSMRLTSLQVSSDTGPSAPPLLHEHVLLHDTQMVAPPSYEESRNHPITPSNY
ncbi:C-type mannose receptor 2 [Mactra antiquata]